MIRKREFLWAALAAALLAYYVTRPRLAVSSSAKCEGKCPGNNGYVDWQ